MFHKIFLGLSAASALAGSQAALAQGDLLVAPTRLVLAPMQGGEVVVSNSGTKTSSYRISLVLRRMDQTGQINAVDETKVSPPETTTLEMINYAPRKITLAPGQSQTVRIGVRPPADMVPGEYRAHLLFRAIPDAQTPAQQEAPAEGMSITLTPIYGVAIPIIVRVGEVAGEARIISARRATIDGQSGVMVDLSRLGQRSVYGTLTLNGAGADKPLAQVKGLAIYPELSHREIFVPVDPKLPQAQAATMVARFVETDPAGKSASTEHPVN